MLPCIIEVALNGLCKKSRNPHAPETIEEIVEDAHACLEAGASIIHVHASRFDLGLDEAVAEYSEIFERILRRHPGAHLYPTGLSASNVADNAAHFPLLAERGLITMGYMDPGSVNLLSEIDESGLPKGGIAYANSYEYCNRQIEWFNAHGIAPSLAIFEPGFLNLVLCYHAAGVLPRGSMIKFYFAGEYSVASGRRTVPHGLPPTPASLEALLAMMGDCPVPWAVSAIGGDLGASPVLPYALARGGHVRVGLEDFGGDRNPTNLELVREAVNMAGRHARRPATPVEAAAILGIPSR